MLTLLLPIQLGFHDLVFENHQCHLLALWRYSPNFDFKLDNFYQNSQFMHEWFVNYYLGGLLTPFSTLKHKPKCNVKYLQRHHKIY